MTKLHALTVPYILDFTWNHTPITHCCSWCKGVPYLKVAGSKIRFLVCMVIFGIYIIIGCYELRPTYNEKGKQRKAQCSQCCWSGMFIPDLGSRIPDPKQQQKRGVKKNCCHTFFCSHKFHKIVHYFIFEMLKKKLLASFQRIIELFTQTIVTKLSNIWVSDPKYGIRDPEKNLFWSRIRF